MEGVSKGIKHPSFRVKQENGGGVTDGVGVCVFVEGPEAVEEVVAE